MSGSLDSVFSCIGGNGAEGAQLWSGQSPHGHLLSRVDQKAVRGVFHVGKSPTENSACCAGAGLSVRRPDSQQ